ncbi:MAG: short-chain dehydrogenase [Hydrocarboniphaga sp.]|uniref:SDR family NAD(P)-dependent oxidoreductase n=1 Tax=Hydrocarboniphaga sp. TaxID=2033016 RepID=UPI002610E720|nr:glucose 1-dehydrogenase [Hydrocarboniphaga sp.]MDB5968659.1 short-chain dehydrogenase [Hydrocarboniphaga sp.]
MTNIDLSGKVAVVTGGSRGLGLEIARGLARAGASVAIASRRLESCQVVAEELIAAGGQASAHAFDAGRWEDCDRLFAEVTARWGSAQILVNNAGKSPVAPSSLETSQDLFDKIIATNLRSVFRLSALFGTQMRDALGGAIVNISSSGSLRPDPSFAPYAAAKMGLNVLTQTFAQEYGPKVRVNTVMPGPFHTGATAAWSHSEAFERHARRNLPLQRGGNPPEIAGAVLFLVSELSSFTTGACLTVDGGHSIGRVSASD